MSLDQVPVEGPAAQPLDMVVSAAPVCFVQHQIFDIAHAWHQVDAQQVGQTKHRPTLRLCVTVNGIGLNFRVISDEPVQDVHRLMHAARNEVAEERDVHVGDMVVANPAVPAITDVILRQQILLIQIPLRAIRGRAFATAPVLR